MQLHIFLGHRLLTVFRYLSIKSCFASKFYSQTTIMIYTFFFSFLQINSKQIKIKTHAHKQSPDLSPIEHPWSKTDNRSVWWVMTSGTGQGITPHPAEMLCEFLFFIFGIITCKSLAFVWWFCTHPRSHPLLKSCTRSAWRRSSMVNAFLFFIINLKRKQEKKRLNGQLKWVKGCMCAWTWQRGSCTDR